MIREQAQTIDSRHNALFKELRRLSRDSTAYRKQCQLWVEGEHLCRAALARGVTPQVAVFSASCWSSEDVPWIAPALKTVVLSDSLFADLSALDSPAKMGLVIGLPTPAKLHLDVPSMILDRVQDAGNVGSLLRSASAFGFQQVIALKGTAALWSPKVLRAGMGAHWGLQLIEGGELETLANMRVPIIVTSSHRGDWLHEMQATKALPFPCAWAFGNEGQGISAGLDALARRHVRIAQPGGEESLNVAAAAAICLHASAALRLLDTDLPRL